MSNEENILKVDVVKITKRNSPSNPSQENDREFTRQLLENIIKELVSFPEDIKVQFSCGERTTIFQVECSQRNLGQLIGAKGKTIQSLRTIFQGVTARKGFRSIIEIPYFENKTT